ncbi:hypothetical protein GWI33_015761 [Rhynchophorus ferrugineus]|uniref:Uncharacterized protein n=1 Tax=Rhynchophorus ferrugineus TaxID=354439 RepID=A0A834M474_RHYFE|nr:hypothetical protein GWI33_015761 [Rhynchophorus ferrugineus]
MNIVRFNQLSMTLLLTISTEQEFNSSTFKLTLGLSRIGLIRAQFPQRNRVEYAPQLARPAVRLHQQITTTIINNTIWYRDGRRQEMRRYAVSQSVIGRGSCFGSSTMRCSPLSAGID